jgi:hypothetical protein
MYIQKISLTAIMVSVFLVFLGLFNFIPVIGFASEQTTDDEYMFPVDSLPYGVSFKEWTQKWWQWYLSIPVQHNPNFEEAEGVKYEPVDCSYLQDAASPVFFVPYVLQEKGQPSAEMTCTVPTNKTVLLGIDNGLMDYGDPRAQPKTVETLVKIVTETNIYPNEFDITLDGKPLGLTNEEKHRVLSDPFNITLPTNNVWDEPPGTYLAVADGWYLMLKPLPTGEHIIHYITGYRDQRSDPTIPEGEGNKNPYIQEVTYRLIVRPTQ